MTYAQQILAAFEPNEEFTTDDILARLDKPITKTVYVCDALKKLIESDKLEQIKMPDERRKYVGHLYRIKQP